MLHSFTEGLKKSLSEYIRKNNCVSVRFQASGRTLVSWHVQPLGMSVCSTSPWTPTMLKPKVWSWHNYFSSQTKFPTCCSICTSNRVEVSPALFWKRLFVAPALGNKTVQGVSPCLHWFRSWSLQKCKGKGKLTTEERLWFLGKYWHNRFDQIQNYQYLHDLRFLKNGIWSNTCTTSSKHTIPTVWETDEVFLRNQRVGKWQCHFCDLWSCSACSSSSLGLLNFWATPDMVKALIKPPQKSWEGSKVLWRSS